MRGRQKLYHEVFTEEKLSQPAKLRKLGRHGYRLDARNQLMLNRYYWHGRQIINNMRPSFDSIIKQMELEFCLSPATIADVLNRHHELLVDIKNDFKDYNNQMLTNALKRKWPWWVW